MSLHHEEPTAQKAKALSRLYTLADRHGGSLRRDSKDAFFLVRPGVPDIRIGGSVDEAIATLNTTEPGHIS